MKSKYRKIQQIQAFLMDQPNDPFLHYALAKEYEKLNLFEEASQKFSELVTQFPNYIGTYYHYGRLLSIQKNHQEALNILEKGIVIAESLGDLHSLAELKNLLVNLELDT